MVHLAGSIVIERPIEEVFDFVADERNEPKYNSALLRSEKVTDGPIGLGTKFSASHKQGRRALDMDIQLTGYERPTRLASTTRMSMFDTEGELTFEPVRTGSTTLRWEWDLHFKGAAKLLAPVAGLIGRRSERACWEGLKRHLESGE